MIDQLFQDIRFGLRMLRSSPGFTAVALLSLTLGIGVATSAFSELNGFVLRDVPGVAKPGDLVLIEPPTSYVNYQNYRDRGDLFAATLAYVAPVPLGVLVAGRTERTWGALVSSSYFAALGVRPSLGRLFDHDADQPGRAPAVVVSYRFWQNHLSSDRSVVGKSLRINGQPCTVIGAAPDGFQGASPLVYVADLWLPASVAASVAPELSGHSGRVLLRQE
ncbi:MAG TPA: ABC transporter permease [Bryobacteraceae bacterium]